MNSKRLDYIDIAKAFAIILVVFGHTAFDRNDRIIRLIYSFHVPVFFILYGFVVKIPQSSPVFKETAVKSFKRYLVPYFWMMVLCGGFNLEKAADYLNVRQSVLVKYEPMASWFLPCFFLSVIIYALIVKAGCRLHERKKQILFIAGCSMLFLAAGLRLSAKRVQDAWMYYNISFTGVGLIAVGLLLRQAWDAVKAEALAPLQAFGFSLIFAGALAYSAFSNGFSAMVLGSYGNKSLFLISSIAGTGFLLMLSKSILIKKSDTPPPILSFLGKNSIVVMMFHHLGFEPVLPVLAAFGIERGEMQGRLLMTLCACLFTGALTYVINTHFPFIIGKGKN